MKKSISLLLLNLFLWQVNYGQINRANTKKSVVYRANYQRMASGANANHSLEIRGGPFGHGEKMPMDN
jgi:hypothetical protein